MSFNDLGLCKELLTALNDVGYTEPTPIQQEAIPVVLKGRDVLACAQTGTGKTASFTLPILQKLHEKQLNKENKKRPVQALILSPTRELAAQIGENVVAYSQHLKLRSLTVFGGVSINPQMMKLRGGVDVLVATPGRLLDLSQKNAVDLSDVEYLVLDEADRMLDMGFIHDIKRILAKLPKRRQNLLFSATFSPEIKKLAESFLFKPETIEIESFKPTPDQITQHIHLVDKSRKRELLAHLITENNWSQVLVFCRTKHGTNRLTEHLNKKGIVTLAIHGNKSQGARTRALSEFKAGTIRVLLATDIVARGLDIAELPYVVNYDLPDQAEDYVHRIGRTGRADAKGEAISLCGAEERDLLKDIEKLLGKPIPRMNVKGFEPTEH
ncbi:MAG: DEAD/DEAH box helicase [Wohlfahrtiimonas sp.]